MKKILVLLVICVTSVATAQDRYTNGMQKAFQLWGEQKPTEASNLFERIAMAEQDNWIPHYYVAHVNTIHSFGEKDFEKLSKQLEKAKEFLDLAKAISPDNPELIVLEALINTAWIAYDGATYGMTLSGKNFQLYEQALAMAPQNPRVVLSKAEWDMGSAKYFGKDVTPYCKDVEKSLELFANFSNDTPFYPSWGKDRAEVVLNQCGE
ncbi:tetratricopeptide repeat protein [Flagellimonas sp.]|uniref:tetratricopeptide repeat protein n=1 Tax=Flagellimonas sp. TaxID=2058762 RepID=UPI003BB0F5E0